MGDGIARCVKAARDVNGSQRASYVVCKRDGHVAAHTNGAAELLHVV